MSDVIFVRTRHEYESYTDFWKLVELSEFPTVYTDEVDIEKDVTYILTPCNGEWRSHIDNQRNKFKRASLINWNLERPGGSNGIGNYIRDSLELMDKGYFDRIWVSDVSLARTSILDYVVLGGHKNFANLNGNHIEKMYDLIHLSYGSPRRAFLFDAPGICKKFLNGMSIAPNAWGIARHNLLVRSRYMLNVHQDNFAFIEPIRFLIAALYKLPILTELCNNPFPYNAVIDIGMLNGNFIGAMKKYVNEYEIHSDRGQAMYNLMTEEYTFRKCIEAKL